MALAKVNCQHGYIIYYDEDKYSDYRSAIDYLCGDRYGIDQNELKTLFDAAFATGTADFETSFQEDFRIRYDFQTRAYTLERQ